MPELPEVETVKRGLAPELEGRRLRRVIQRRPDLRFPLPANFAAYALIPVGYPLGRFGPVTRRPVSEVMRFDRWS